MVGHNWLRILASFPVRAISLGLLVTAGGAAHLSAASAFLSPWPRPTWGNTMRLALPDDPTKAPGWIWATILIACALALYFGTKTK